jgi:hypothetical protein
MFVFVYILQLNVPSNLFMDGNTADHIDEDVPHDLHIKNKSLLQESSDLGPEMAQSLEMVHDFGSN